jgi:hypothetical protein
VRLLGTPRYTGSNYKQGAKIHLQHLLLGAHHFLHISRIRVKLLTFRLLMSYIQGAAREMTCFEISRTVLNFQGK